MKRNISILVFLIALVCVEIFLNHSYNNTIVYGIGLAILLVIGGILWIYSKIWWAYLQRLGRWFYEITKHSILKYKEIVKKK